MKLFIFVISLLPLVGCVQSFNSSICMEQVRMSYCEPYYDHSSGTTKYDCTKIKPENKSAYDQAILACIQSTKYGK